MVTEEGRGKRSGATRARILDAAFEAITADGIDGFRLGRISETAEVSTASIHYHFATRDELLAEALLQAYDRAGEIRTELTGVGRGISQRLSDMVQHSLPDPRGDSWVLWVELWLRAHRRPALGPVAEELYSRMHDWFGAVIGEGVAAGEFSACDVGRTADLAMALIDGFGHRVLWGDGNVSFEGACREVNRVLAGELGIEALPDPTPLRD